MARLYSEQHADYRALVAKLRAGDALSPDDRATLRLLIVGDAAYYVRYDEEFARCRDEVRRIVGEIERLKAGELGVDALMHLSVLCEEASSLLAPTRHYLDARDRVRRFDAATSGTISRDDALALAAMIERMVAPTR